METGEQILVCQVLRICQIIGAKPTRVLQWSTVKGEEDPLETNAQPVRLTRASTVHRYYPNRDAKLDTYTGGVRHESEQLVSSPQNMCFMSEHIRRLADEVRLGLHFIIPPHALTRFILPASCRHRASPPPTRLLIIGNLNA